MLTTQFSERELDSLTVDEILPFLTQINQGTLFVIIHQVEPSLSQAQAAISLMFSFEWFNAD